MQDAVDELIDVAVTMNLGEVEVVANHVEGEIQREEDGAERQVDSGCIVVF